MGQLQLEAPGTKETPEWDSLYRAKATEVNPARPIFTGDILQVDRALGVVLQHPCALRVDGVDLVDRLLVAKVVTSSPIAFGGWRGSYRKMPFPNLFAAQTDDFWVGSFLDLDLWSPTAVSSAARVACLSQLGVNLLMQRWVNHNSRVVVPTFQFQEATAAAFEEVDLLEEWAEEMLDLGHAPSESWSDAHAWLRTDAGDGTSWQEKLDDPQSRSAVRRALRVKVKERLRTET